MRALCSVVLLLVLLRPAPAAAGERPCGEVVAGAAAQTGSGERDPSLEAADGLEPGASMREPTDRSDPLPQGSTPRAASRLRLPRAAAAAAASAPRGRRVVPPHCERLPYHATAPPRR